MTIGKSAFPGIKKGRVGRPSIYTPELLDVICERIAEGEAVRWILVGPGMPHRSTFQRWLARSRRAGRLRAALVAAGEWLLKPEAGDGGGSRPGGGLNHP